MPRYRYPQAPWDFQCPYKHSCPHLEGLSTQWVFEEYQRAYDEHCEHWKARDLQQEDLEKALRYIGELEKQNEELKAKLKALHQRQFKAKRKAGRQSTSNGTDDNCAVAGKKKTRCTKRASWLVPAPPGLY